jgi:hypothetical protein
MKSQLLILLVLISSLFNTACAYDTYHDPKYVEGVVQRSNGEKLINYEVVLTSNPNNLWNQFKGGWTTIKIGTDKTKENGSFNILLNDGKIPPKLLLDVVSKKYKLYIINNRVTKIYYHYSAKKIKINTPNVITVPDDF